MSASDHAVDRPDMVMAVSRNRTDIPICTVRQQLTNLSYPPYLPSGTSKLFLGARQLYDTVVASPPHLSHLISCFACPVSQAGNPINDLCTENDTSPVVLHVNCRRISPDVPGPLMTLDGFLPRICRADDCIATPVCRSVMNKRVVEDGQK